MRHNIGTQKPVQIVITQQSDSGPEQKARTESRIKNIVQKRAQQWSESAQQRVVQSQYKREWSVPAQQRVVQNQYKRVVKTITKKKARLKYISVGTHRMRHKRVIRDQNRCRREHNSGQNQNKKMKTKGQAKFYQGGSSRKNSGTGTVPAQEKRRLKSVHEKPD